MQTLEALRARKSIRSFLDKPVDAGLIEAMIQAARHAPSAVNSQPWRVAVVQNKSLKRLSQALMSAAKSDQPDAEVNYYPREWFEPYRSRRRACGLALYRALEITKNDTNKQNAARLANFRFFDAPIGIILLTHRDLSDGALVDMGLFLQSLMLCATDFGLGSCALGSITEYPRPIRQCLNLEEHWRVVVGLAVGWPDSTAPINQFRADRALVNDFISWHE